MLTIYLNTKESIFLDGSGNGYPAGSPALSVSGKEEIHLVLKKSTPNWGTPRAFPEAWEPDNSWGNIPGISAMLTVANDYRKYTQGKLTADLFAGAVSATVSIDDARELPSQGIIRFLSADTTYEDVCYSSLSMNDTEVVFNLATPITANYRAGSYVDCTVSPLAQSYLAAEKSNWNTGELVFDLVLDSERLRDEKNYKDQASIPILGLELLLFAANEKNVQILRAFLLDSASLRNVIGNPGFNAPVPDTMRDNITAEVGRQIEQVVGRVTPQISAAGTWVVDGKDTNIKATGAPAGFGSVTAEISMLAQGAEPEVDVESTGPDTAKEFKFKFGIPASGPGETGGSAGNTGVIERVIFDQVGSLADRVFYDEEKKGFAYLTTQGDLYVKLSDSPADWSVAVHLVPTRGVDYWTDEDKEAIKDEMLNKGW